MRPAVSPGQVHPACLAGRRAAIAVDRVDGPRRRVLWPRRCWGQGGLPGLRAALLPVRLGGRGRHSRGGVVMILVPGPDRAPTRAPARPAAPEFVHDGALGLGLAHTGAATEPDMALAHRSVLVPGGVPDVPWTPPGPSQLYGRQTGLMTRPHCGHRPRLWRRPAGRGRGRRRTPCAACASPADEP